MTDCDDVKDTINVMLLAVDALDWKIVREAFTDRVFLDYTSLFGGEDGVLSADEMIGNWKSFLPGFKATQHLIGPIAVHEESDTAVSARTNVRAYHVGEGGGGTWMVAGRYEFKLQRTNRWRIQSIHLTFFYEKGGRQLVDIAKDRARTRPRLTRV